MFNNLKNKEQEELLPEHIGIIMDGNGRWAKQKGKPRIFGHKAGMDSLKDVAVHGARSDDCLCFFHRKLDKTS